MPVGTQTFKPPQCIQRERFSMISITVNDRAIVLSADPDNPLRWVVRFTEQFP
jgi:hypothetical protein